MGAYDVARARASGTLGAVDVLVRGDAEIAINWSGGMHRARPDMAMEDCYLNDAVLSVIRLLQANERVMVVNIGNEHPDALESAFYTTAHVLSISFHSDQDQHIKMEIELQKDLEERRAEREEAKKAADKKEAEKNTEKKTASGDEKVADSKKEAKAGDSTT